MKLADAIIGGHGVDHSNILLEAILDVLVLTNFIKIDSNAMNYCLPLYLFIKALFL